jgi:hypothetical protein
MEDLYDDGPVSIDDIFTQEDQQKIVRRLNEISAWRLQEMISKYPTLKKSWESFLIDYHICLSNEPPEEHDDIPF